MAPRGMPIFIRVISIEVLVLAASAIAAAQAQPPNGAPAAQAPPPPSPANRPAQAADSSIDRAIELAQQHNHLYLEAHCTTKLNRAEENSATLRPPPVLREMMLGV